MDMHLENKQLNGSLSDLPEPYFTLVENSIIGLFVFQDFRFVFVNNAFAKFTGYSREELLSMDIDEVKNLIHPDFREGVLNNITRRLAGKEVPDKYEVKFLKKDRTYCWVEIIPERIIFNEKSAIQASLLDISERKTAEINLRIRFEIKKIAAEISGRLINSRFDKLDFEIENALKSITRFLNASRGFYYLLSDDGEYRFSELFEWCEENILPRNKNIQNYSFRDFTYAYSVLKQGKCLEALNFSQLPDEAATEKVFLQKYDEKALIMIPGFYNHQLKAILGFNYNESVAEPLGENLNTLQTILDLLLNIYLRKHASILLYESEQKYKSIFDLTPAIILLLDENDIIINVNKNLTETLGYSPAEFMGKNIFDLNCIDEKNKKRLHKGFQDRNIFPVKIELFSKNNELFHFQLNSSFIKSENRVSSNLLVLSDISAIVKSEVAMYEYSQKLVELNQSKDKFFSIIAHDLRSPFLGILGFSNLLIEDFNVLPDEDKMKYIFFINESVNDVYNLVENLLQWSRVETNQISAEFDVIKLYNFVDRAVKTIRNNALSKKITIENKVTNDLHVRSDKNILTSVLNNLLSNAVKFTHAGGNIEVNCIVEESEVIVSVTDNGTGMNQTELEKLFKSGERFSNKGTDNERGSGLGLKLCRELIEKNGGRIFAESTPQKGSKFSFSLQKV